MEQQIITTAVELIKTIKASDIAQISFIKKDKSERLMKCTLNFAKIPIEHRPKNLKIENILQNLKKNILHVYDVENKGWRSIPVNTTKFIISNGKKFFIDLDFNKRR